MLDTKKFSFWESIVVAVSYLVHIWHFHCTKADEIFNEKLRFLCSVYYKMQLILLQNETTILLWNTTKLYYKISCFNWKMRKFYCKIRHFKIWRYYFKIRQLLQNVMFITKCVGTCINKIFLCDWNILVKETSCFAIKLHIV